MRAARFYEVGKPLVVEDVPRPQPRPGEVLLKVKACGLCGSDIHIVFEGVTPTAYRPITLGHEISAEIAALGDGVDRWNVGDRVAVSCIVSCGRCESCLNGDEQLCPGRRLLGVDLDGGLAEYVCVPAGNLVALPDGISYEEGAILTDAVATPYRAIVKRGRLAPGECVAIMGCGGLGVHAVKLARIFGAGMIIGVDVSDAPLDRALAYGADRVCRADRENPVGFIKKATHGRGADLAIECVGRKKTIKAAVSCLRSGGRAVVVGLGPEAITLSAAANFVLREVQLLGSFAFTVREIEELVELATAGRLDISGSVSKKIALADVNEGLNALHRKAGNPVRIVVSI